MKIGILSDFAKTGGAAIAADRIATSLQKAGTDLFRISSDGCSNSLLDEETLTPGRKHSLLDLLFSGTSWGRRLPSKRAKELCRQFDKLLARRKPDLINAHNLHGVDWPMELIEIALRHCPVCWTLHDCTTFLGSYYPSHSPRPSSDSVSKLKSFWKRIATTPPVNSISAIAPSKWMKSEADSSHWATYDTALIPYPIPSDFTRSGNPQANREALRLEADKPVVLTIAGNLDEDRKGGQTIHQMFRDQKFKGVQFLVAGQSQRAEDLPENVRLLGFVGDQILLRIAYTAADFLLHPAPVDNLPNTVIESLSCGTPVLAFPTGGLPDMVVPDHSGWLSSDISTDSISEMMVRILEDRSYEKLGEGAKQTAQNLFNEEKIAKIYQRQFLKTTNLVNTKQ